MRHVGGANYAVAAFELCLVDSHIGLMYQVVGGAGIQRHICYADAHRSVYWLNACGNLEARGLHSCPQPLRESLRLHRAGLDQHYGELFSAEAPCDVVLAYIL